MKLNWFTPLPPARSDIANSVARILPVLAKRAEVTLWTDARDVDSDLRRYAQIRHYDPDEMDWAALNYADYTLYNVGNDGRFHAGLMKVARKHPGVVLLHDISVHELALATLRQGPCWRERYMNLLEPHGPDAVKDAVDLIEGRKTPDELATAYPLGEWAFEGAHGVVVHNGPFFRRLYPRPDLPILDVPLPYLGLDQLQPVTVRHWDSGPLELVICGYLNSPNRRLGPVLDALASFPQKERLRLHIAGQVRNEKALKRQLKGLGIRKQVRLYGFVSDEKLGKLLNNAHLALNLRYPSRGEASGAQLRFWNHTLPTVVSRTGWYAELPEDSVIHINPEAEETELHRVWQQALDDYSSLAVVGETGRQLLAERHSAETFVDALLDFLPIVGSYRAEAFAIKLAQRAGLCIGEFQLPAEVKERFASSVAGSILRIASLAPQTQSNAAD